MIYSLQKPVSMEEEKAYPRKNSSPTGKKGGDIMFEQVIIDAIYNAILQGIIIFLEGLHTAINQYPLIFIVIVAFSVATWCNKIFNRHH